MRQTNIIGAPKLKMGTFCSGIGAPEVAARGMFEPIWFSEIEPFPCAVLAHHWPQVPNLGDMTAPDLVERIASAGLPDVVVAGLPCQPFSVAGLRNGEADPRNLTARFVEIADAIDDLRHADGKPPVWWLVENVPGLLSDKGNAFGALLGGMVGSSSAIVPGGRWECSGVATGPRRSAAWRVLDAQFFGVAQRRRRVFAIFVADSGSLKCADALLPIINSMSWHTPPRREAGERPAPTISARTRGGGGLGTDFDCDGGLIAHTLRGEGFDASEDGTGRRTPLVPVSVAMRGRDEGAQIEIGDECAFTLRASTGGGDKPHVFAPVAFDLNQITSKVNRSRPDPAVHHTLPATACPPHLATEWAVRRLTPRETARLQGFPDDHTAITYRGKPAADGPQYKAHGNSMAVPVIRWIMDRMRISMEDNA